MNHSRKLALVFAGSVLILLSCIFSCASVTESNSPSNEKSLFSRSTFRKGSLIHGTSRIEFYLNDYLIVGILTEERLGMDSLDYDLKNLELDWNADSIFIMPELNIGWTHTVFFSTIRKLNSERFANQDSEALEFLRDKYWNNFGMGIYDESGKVMCVLKNDLIVGFKSGKEKEKIEELLTSYGATRIIPRPAIGSEYYYVQFPNDWGYKIIDIGDELFELIDVISVEHQYRTIKHHT